jgi:hypothetical protein
MSKEDEYRKNAAATVDLVQRAASMKDKARLLAMAEAWLDLADRTHKIPHRHVAKAKEHPLIRRVLSKHERQFE